MNKKILIMFAVLAVLAAAIGILKFSSEDSWLCVDGQWVRHGHPDAPAPAGGCGQADNGKDKTPDQDKKPDDSAGPIRVSSPLADAEIASPLDIAGEAPGSWFFEASFPVRLEDGSGKVLASGPAQAQSDWMTEDFVPFRLSLEFSAAAETGGWLVLAKDNPSGLPENNEEYRLPVKIKAGAEVPILLIKAFFMNNQLDPDITCAKAFPVERRIVKTAAVARTAIDELLKGPTDAEISQGYSTSLPAGVKIQSLSIEQGKAKIDFNSALEENIAGSCRVSAIRAQIEETLKQFSSVERVVISINNRTEDILQP